MILCRLLTYNLIFGRRLFRNIVDVERRRLYRCDRQFDKIDEFLSGFDRED